MSTPTPVPIAEHPDAPAWLRRADTSGALITVEQGRVIWHAGHWFGGHWRGGAGVCGGGAGGGETGEDEE